MNRNRLRALVGVVVGLPLLAAAGYCQTPLFPDTNLTPGVTRVVPAKAVCVPGSSKAVRNVPTSEKNAVYKEYKILHRAPGSYEIDHDLSLELGGSNDIGNLWPEGYDINVNGFNEGAHTKDALENKLHSLVCSGKLTLKQAQDAIRGDWRPAYLKYVSPTFPPYRVKAGSKKSTLKAHPASDHALMQRRITNWASGITRPVDKQFRFAKGGQRDGVAPIPTVSRVGNPAAILRGVGTIVVAPVDAEVGGISVGESPITEGTVVILPFSANSNAPPPISGIARVTFVEATELHPPPDVIEARSDSMFPEVLALRDVVGALLGTVMIARVEHANKITSPA